MISLKKNPNNQIFNVDGKYIKYFTILQCCLFVCEIILRFSQFSYLIGYMSLVSLPLSFIIVGMSIVNIRRYRVRERISNNEYLKTNILCHHAISSLYSNNLIKPNQDIFILFSFFLSSSLNQKTNKKDVFKYEKQMVLELFQSFGLIGYKIYSLYDVYLIAIFEDKNMSNYFRLLHDDIIFEDKESIKSSAFARLENFHFIHYNCDNLLELIDGNK